MIDKDTLNDIFFSEFWCSQAMKNVFLNTIHWWHSYIWNEIEIYEKDWKIYIQSLFDENDNYSLDKEEFFKYLEDYFNNC